MSNLSWLPNPVSEGAFMASLRPSTEQSDGKSPAVPSESSAFAFPQPKSDQEFMAALQSPTTHAAGRAQAPSPEVTASWMPKPKSTNDFEAAMRWPIKPTFIKEPASPSIRSQASFRPNINRGRVYNKQHHNRGNHWRQKRKTCPSGFWYEDLCPRLDEAGWPRNGSCIVAHAEPLSPEELSAIQEERQIHARFQSKKKTGNPRIPDRTDIAKNHKENSIMTNRLAPSRNQGLSQKNLPPTGFRYENPTADLDEAGWPSDGSKITIASTSVASNRQWRGIMGSPVGQQQQQSPVPWARNPVYESAVQKGREAGRRMRMFQEESRRGHPSSSRGRYNKGHVHYERNQGSASFTLSPIPERSPPQVKPTEEELQKRREVVEYYLSHPDEFHRLGRNANLDPALRDEVHDAFLELAGKKGKRKLEEKWMDFPESDY